MRLAAVVSAIGLAVVLSACGASGSPHTARVTTTSTVPRTTTTTSDGFCAQNFPTGPDRAECDQLHINGYKYTPPTPEESLQRSFDSVTHSPSLRKLMVDLQCTLTGDGSFQCPSDEAYDALHAAAEGQAQCELESLSTPDEVAPMDCNGDGQPG